MPTCPRFSPFVELKRGDEGPPILLAHGLDGRASFSGLAEHIRTGNAVYGIQAKGLDGMDEPLDRIEDMAAFYLEALSDLQPQGPYILIGYSFGGLVALEMAQRLSRSGKKVGLLVLVDAYPHPRFLSPAERLRLIVRRTCRHISEMKKLSASEAISYFVGGLRRRLRIVGVRAPNPSVSQGSQPSAPQPRLRVRDSAYVAFQRYCPRFYRGKIFFVSAAENSYFPDDPVAIWGKLADEFENETVPGGHLNIVTTEFQGLADALTRYVRRANTSPPV
jgi:acetoacetyl-CoA synthetase